jgi:hypothetical protein
MATINGGHLVARRTNGKGNDVILVHKQYMSYEEYVTGVVAAGDDNPTEWFWGHYFKNFSDAAADFCGRPIG